MPICPFCRKPVDPGSIWCSCGANLVRYPNLPVNSKDVKDWLAKYEPQFLTSSWAGGSLLERAKRQLMSGQDKEISANTKINAEMTEAKGLIKNFLLDCQREGLVPTIDIGSLRRDRWRQWKRIPAEYRQHAPLKNFKLTPGYFFETSVADFKDEYCLGVDGALYKHQLNAPDPFELEDLLGVIPAHKLAEALAAALVELLKAKQQPDAGQHKQISSTEISGTAAIEEGSTPEAPAAAVEDGAPRRRLRLPFGLGGRKSGGTQTPQETAEVSAPTPALETAATEAAQSALITSGPAIAGESGAPTEPAPAPEAAPAVAAAPKRRIGKADRRTSAPAKAVTAERRAAKTDRRAPKTSKEPAGATTAKAVKPERRATKTERRTTAKAVTVERRTVKTDRRAPKTSKATATVAGVGAAKPAPEAEPENGSREKTGVRLEPTKS